MKLRDQLIEKRDQILRIAAKHGASNLKVIGSVARGDERPDSDIDFLVEWDPESSLLDQAGLILELQALLNRKVDVASEGWLKSRIQDQIHEDAVPL